MLALKRAFDPKGLLNPGKVIPTLERCAEYGKMHVQARPAAVRRPAALLIAPCRPMDATDPALLALVDRVQTARAARAPRSASAAAAPRTSTARRRRASRSTRARSHGISSYEPTELVVTDALRHAAGRARGAAGRRRASACRSSRRTSRAGAHASAAWSPPASPGPSRATRRLGARPRARRHPAQRPGEVLTFGGQVMKNVAGYDVSRAAGRLAGHARRDPARSR